MRKKNLEFLKKCGFEINKEIIEIEADKSWVLIQIFGHYRTKKT